MEELLGISRKLEPSPAISSEDPSAKPAACFWLWGGAGGNSWCKGAVLGARQARLGTQEGESTWAGVGRDEEETRTGREAHVPTVPGRGGLGPRETGNESLRLLHRRGSGQLAPAGDPRDSAPALGQKHPKGHLLCAFEVSPSGKRGSTHCPSGVGPGATESQP